jgi:hypothetical protein
VLRTRRVRRAGRSASRRNARAQPCPCCDEPPSAARRPDAPPAPARCAQAAARSRRGRRPLGKGESDKWQVTGEELPVAGKRVKRERRKRMGGVHGNLRRLCDG